MTVSTVLMMRSTSLEKSACPGVSTMLILTPLVDDGTVLGVDGDAAFTFQVVAVHDAVHDLFIGTEYIALAQECVHQRGFSSVDMGDDGYIDDLFFFVHYAFTSLQTYIII